jgi:ribosome-binding protein aMBF1 (putative translation factor)
MQYHHQDWTPVIVNKRNISHDAEAKKRISQLEPTHLRELKADDAETYRNKLFDQEFIKNVIKKRLDRKFTQRDLAKMLNVDVSIVQRLEQGKLVYDHALKSKINRCL